jgi:hypothetical protein
MFRVQKIGNSYRCDDISLVNKGEYESYVPMEVLSTNRSLNLSVCLPFSLSLLNSVSSQKCFASAYLLWIRSVKIVLLFFQ